jgi:hypothetical protein
MTTEAPKFLSAAEALARIAGGPCYCDTHIACGKCGPCIARATIARMKDDRT